MSWKSVMVGLAAGVLVAGVAGAVVYDPILDYEIRLPQSQVARTYVQPDAVQATQLLPSLAAFNNGEGSGWKLIEWNAQLGTPASIGGPAIPMLSSEASEEAIRAAVESFVARNQDLLRADLRELRLTEVVDISPDRKYAIFNQYSDGLEVLFGRLDVALWKGSVVLLGSEVYPNVEVSRFPTLDARSAADAAHLGIPQDPSDAVQGTPRLVILPLEPNGAPVYHLAWEIMLQTHDPENVWRTYVDAHDGSVLWRQSEHAFFQVNGTVRGSVEENFNDPQDYPLEDARVRASGTYTGYTNDAGNFTIEVPNNVDYNNVSETYGLWCNANRADGTDASITIVGGPGDPVNFVFDDTNSHAAERSAFYHVNVVHDWIKGVDPTFNDLDYVMSANVNINGTCNAFWNGSSVNFYKEGGGCNNSGRISDVVYHEYGHGITQELYSPQGAPTASGMGEALSDVDAMCIHRDSEVGEFFNTNGSPVRTGENLRQYPGSECGGEVHCLGEILMGSMWKSMKLFKQKYGAASLPGEYDLLYVNTIKTKQTNMPNFLTRLLMTNDNDGNLANGTPDYYEICDAFALHNLPCNAITNYVTVSSAELPDQPQDSGTYAVTAIVQSVGGGALDPNQIEVFYTTDPVGTRTTWNTVLMTATGQPNEYRGQIPLQECGTVVTYYVRAAKLTGEFATAPALAPYRDVYKFLTGPTLTALNDNLETDQGWTIGWAGDTATEGVWQRADPALKNSATYGDTQPEDDHTAAGTLCFVTDPTGGIWSRLDVDNGITSVVSPVFNWAGRTAAGISFWYFYFDYTPTDDSLRCAISNDNGVTWKDVFKRNGTGYNQWQYDKVYVTDADISFTAQMRIRFTMEDLGTPTTCAEGLIDDIQVIVSDCVLTDVADGTLPARFVVEENRPNPFNPRTSIRFGLPSAGPVDVSVFDAGGRRVRTLMDGSREAGYHTVVWDGRDDHGHAVGSGVYYYTVKTDRESQSHKMMLLK